MEEELQNKEIVGMPAEPEVLMGEVPEVVAPQSLEDAIALETPPSIDYDSFKSTESKEFEVEDFDKSDRSIFQRYAEVMNPYGQQYMDSSLVGERPIEEDRDWSPSNDKWYNSLTPEQKAVVFDSPTRAYAELRLRRQGSYMDAAATIADDSLWTAIPMGLATGIIAPESLIPGGFVFRGTKVALTVGDKLTKLAQVVGTSAAAASAGASFGEAVMEGSGATEADYLQANLWAVGIGGGLPMVSKVIGSSYDVGNTAKALSTSPKEFAVLSGELALNKLDMSARNTSMYAKLAPQWAQSDVFITSASKNVDVSNISSRIDSPSVAMIDRETGKPVPIKTTMQDFKIKMHGEFAGWKNDMNVARQEAMENGWTGNSEQFNKEVGQLMRERANRQDMEVYSALEERTAATRMNLESEIEFELNTRPATDSAETLALARKTLVKEMEATLAAERAKIKDELYNEIQLDFNTPNAGLKNAAQKTADHYDMVRDKGANLGSQELTNLPQNRHYMTRIYDFNKVQSMDINDLASVVRKAMASHPANSAAGITAKKLDAMASDMATKLKGLEYDRAFADFSFFVPDEMGINSFLKSKKYRLDESKLGDILQNDMSEVMGQYTYKMSGQLSALHAFPEALKDVPLAEQAKAFREKFIEPLRERAVASGIPLKEAEIQGLERMFDDALGTFRMQRDGRSGSAKTMRLLNGWNSLSYGGGFGLNTFSEVGGLLLGGNMRNLAKARLAPMKDIATMFNQKGIKDPMVRDFMLAGQMDQLFEHKGMMRMADTEGLFNVGKLEKFNNDANDFMYKWNGLRPLTTALEMIAGPKLVHDVLDMGSATGKLSLKDEKFLARVGLTQKDASDINALMRKHGKFDESGRITDMGLDKWADTDMADALTTAISRGMRHAIIKGDTTYLPHWMIDPNRPIVRLTTTFLRFPLAASETLMARGMDESMAQWAAGTAVSTMAFASVLYLREQAALAVGAKEEVDAKYSNAFEDREEMGNLLMGAMLRSGTLGGASIGIEKGLNIAGISTPGTEYVGNTLENTAGPTAGRLNQLQDILSAAVQGDYQDKASWYATKSMLPFASMPILNEALGTLIKENSY